MKMRCARLPMASRDQDVEHCHLPASANDGSERVGRDCFPKARLANGEIEVSIFLPDAERGYYRGTCSTGRIIEHVDYRGHRFLHAPLHAEHDP